MKSAAILIGLDGSDPRASPKGKKQTATLAARSMPAD
jgi:hypothetical protein